MSLRIDSVEIGEGHPCRFVAEISNNHNGDLDRALRLIDAAKAAGADFVKFQCYTPAELVTLRGDGPAPEPWGSQGWTTRDLYEKARTPLEWFPQLFQHARDIGIVPFSSIFGGESWRVLRAIDCPAYKIARLDNQDRHLAIVAQMPNRVVVVSTSGEPTPPIATPSLRLFCPKGYPQSAPFFEWDAFRETVESGSDWIRPGYDGFSFHGTDATPCVVAATLGAKLIEAHFMLAEEPSELEAHVSLDQYQFAKMIADVRAVEEMLA